MDEPATPSPLPVIDVLLRHRAWLRRLAASLVVDAASADDLAQQTLLAALERPPPNPGHPRAWLGTAVRHLARKLGGRERSREERERVAARREAQPGADEVVARAAIEHDVSTAVLALPEPYRTALLLRFFDDLPPRVIAERTDAPIETVRTRIRRGVELVRAELVKRRGDPAVLLGLLDATGRRAVKQALLGGTTAMALGVLGVIGMSMKVKLVAAAVVIAAGTFAVIELCQSPVTPPRTVVAGATRSPPDLPAPATVDAPSSASAEASRTTEPRSVESSIQDGVGSLLVRVTWKRDGSSASNVGVSCEQGMSWIQGRTGVDGSIVFDRVPAGQISVIADRGERVDGVVDANRQTEIGISISPGITIEGSVVDFSGTSIPNAEIWMSAGNNFVLGQIVAFSAGDGSFVIHDAGPYVFGRGAASKSSERRETSSRYVGARAHGYVPSDIVTLDVSATWTPLRLVLPAPGSTITGCVLDPSGAAVARALVSLTMKGRAGVNTRDSMSIGGMARVTLGSIMDITDELGRFEFLGWPRGASEMVVRARPWAVWSSIVELSKGEATYKEILLSAGSLVTGVVSTQEGMPAGRATVRCKTGFGGPVVYTESDGTFSMPGVPAGEVVLEAESRDGRVTATLQGQAGEAIVWNPVLAAGAAIQGQLLSDSGAPLEAWFVDVIEELEGRPYPGAATDRQGVFFLKSLGRGKTYRLVVRGGPIPSMSVEHVQTNGEDVRIVVPREQMPSAAIAGTVVDMAGNRVGGADVLIRSERGQTHATSDIQTGDFRVIDLIPGTYHLIVTATGFSELQTDGYELSANQDLMIGHLRLSAQRGGP